MRVRKFLEQDLRDQEVFDSIQLAGGVPSASAPPNTFLTSSAPFSSQTGTTSQSSGGNALSSSSSTSTGISLSIVPGSTHKPQAPASTPPGHVFVLLCVRRGNRLHHTQIDTTRCAYDDEFFEVFRREYWQLRGFWHFWFDPRQFAFCHFSNLPNITSTALQGLVTSSHIQVLQSICTYLNLLISPTSLQFLLRNGIIDTITSKQDVPKKPCQ
jgi:hypothetical protein